MVQRFLGQPPPTRVPSLKTRILLALGTLDGQGQGDLIDLLIPQVPDEVAQLLEGNNPRRALVMMALGDLEGGRQIRREGKGDTSLVWLMPPPPDPRFELHPILSQELPPVSAELDRDLEWQLVTQGCLDELRIWKDEGRTFLVDGYRRQEKCRRHGLPFALKDLGPLSLAEVRAWMWATQGSRRNLTALAQSYSRGLRYNENNPGPGRPPRRRARDPRSTLRPTAKLAAQYEKSERTLRRDARFARALDAVTAICGPAFRTRVLSGTLAAGPTIVQQLARLSAERMQQQVLDWLEGRLPAPREATSGARLVLRGEDVHQRADSLLEQEGWEAAKKFHAVLGLLLDRRKRADSA